MMNLNAHHSTPFHWNGETYFIYVFRDANDAFFSEIHKNEVPINYSCYVTFDVHWKLWHQHRIKATDWLVEDAKLTIQEGVYTDN